MRSGRAPLQIRQSPSKTISVEKERSAKVKGDDYDDRLKTQALELDDLSARVIELRRTTAALEEARDRYLDLYVNAPLPYVVFDLDGTLRKVNHAAVAMLGVSARKLVGASFERMLESESRAAFRQHLRAVGDAGGSVTTDVALAGRGTDRRIVRMVSVPVADETSEVMAMFFDVTEQKRCEGSLEYLNRASSFFASAAMPTAIVDELPRLCVPHLADVCVGELYEAGGDAHLAFGATERYPHALGLTARAFMKVPAVANAITRSIASGSPEPIEPPDSTRGAPASGKADLEPKSLLALPLTGRGRVYGVLVLAALGDDSRVRSLDAPLSIELARRASLAIDNARMFVELHEEQATRNRFLAMLAHELRTPLTPVLAAVTALLEQCGSSGSELERLLKMTRDNVTLEARLIDDLVDVVRAARGEFELKLESIDARETIRNVVDVCRDELVKKKITFAVELGAESHRVCADPARLQQILWNLLRNAIKFTPEAGVIRLGSRSVKDRLYVEVTDTGIGIEKVHIGKIFDPFAQADTTIGPKFGGMGLGLAICKVLAQAHHGKIVVTSPGVGRGATFTFDIPLDSSAPALELPIEAPAVESGRVQEKPPSDARAAPPDTLARVLLVEDDTDTREVTAALLARAQYSVTKASTLAEAVAAAREQSFDILIADQHLPDGTGIHLMRRLRFRTRDLRGVVLSGDASPEDVERAKAAGFTFYLKKPVTFADLRTALERLA